MTLAYSDLNVNLRIDARAAPTPVGNVIQAGQYYGAQAHGRAAWRQARQIVFTLDSLRRRKRQASRSTFPFSFRPREPGSLSEEFR
jgi:hypothetical protein